MYRLVLLTSLSVALAVECPMRLLYSNETQAQSVDKYNYAVLTRTTTLGRAYFEPDTARCVIVKEHGVNADVSCHGISSAPYAQQYNKVDRVLLVFRSPECAIAFSDFKDYITLGKDEYLPLGSICKPMMYGYECYGSAGTKLVHR